MGGYSGSGCPVREAEGWLKRLPFWQAGSKLPGGLLRAPLKADAGSRREELDRQAATMTKRPVRRLVLDEGEYGMVAAGGSRDEHRFTASKGCTATALVHGFILSGSCRTSKISVITMKGLAIR